ncbi:MAG: ATP-binding protein [Bradymonadia bacterium]
MMAGSSAVPAHPHHDDQALQRQLQLADLTAKLSTAEDEPALVYALTEALSSLEPTHCMILWVPPDAAPTLWTAGPEGCDTRDDELTLQARLRLEPGAPKGLTPKRWVHINRSWRHSTAHTRLICHPILVHNHIRGMVAVRVPADLGTDNADLLRMLVARVGPPMEQLRRLKGLARTNQELDQASEALKRTQADLVSAERMAALGQMATGVAHEINNPLAYVKSNIEVMRHYLEALSEVIRLHGEGDHESARMQAVDLHHQGLVGELRDLIDETTDGAERAYKVVRDLKAFGPQATSSWVKLDPAELVQNTLHVLHGDIKARATVTAEIFDSPLVYGDTGRLRQALMCLLVNAAQAIPLERRGRIEVRCRPEGDGVCIEVADNGEGVSAEQRSRIFEPFFTTRSGTLGSGLGLAIVRDVVRGHGGRVDVRSVPGEGSVFAIWLPPAQSLAAEDRPTVLFVDDAQVWLNAYHRAYSANARVILAHGTTAGIKALSQEPHIDAVVCDLHLPDQGGQLIYNWLAEHQPQLCNHFVGATDGPHDDGIRRFLDTTELPVLYKSFGMADLNEALAKVLED